MKKYIFSWLAPDFETYLLSFLAGTSPHFVEKMSREYCPIVKTAFSLSEISLIIPRAEKWVMSFHSSKD